jgi:nitroimidazol reductase NimA-like FMN-containing flavoprotein (pyridoxamine 5'-phosphate oxidase superfamily)
MKAQSCRRKLGKLKMVIRELTRQASLDLLKRTHLGRLACARANRPYIIPIYFAYQDNSLYCAATVGQKIEWMRENPLVAVEVDQIDSAQQWETVIVSGRYDEIVNTPEGREKRELAWSLLQDRKLWWEPCFVETILGGKERPMVPLYFRILIERITGHRGTNERSDMLHGT